MSVHSEKSTWLIFLTLCLPLLVLSSEETQMEQTMLNVTEPKSNSTKDLLASETADPKKIDIVKQIRRLNDDGSYTVGYEADDGTFKIESRDVQGNIKGTFGYVDEDGEIKRVSYSSSNGSHSPLLIPLVPVVRINKTSSPTTRRPQPTIIYSKSSSSSSSVSGNSNGSSSTKSTVIQSIPRRRPVSSSTPSSLVTTTESYRVVSGNSLSPNTTNSTVSSSVPKILRQFPIFSTRLETSKPVLLPESNTNEPKIYYQSGQQRIAPDLNETETTTIPNFIRSTILYDKTIDRIKEHPKNSRANTFRRQLHPTNFENEHMYALRQSLGEDTTDVYGGSIAVGTARPLFTTTTIRPRPTAIHTILASRQKLQEKLSTPAPQINEEQQETTLEATTNKIEGDSFVTSNPVPLLRVPIPNENVEHRAINPAFVRTPIHFRTREFLRDNPGAPIPIGNQRVLLKYNPNVQIDGNGQYIRQITRNIVPIPNPQLVNNVQNEPVPEEIENEKPNLISIPVQSVQQVPRYPTYNEYIQQQNRIETASQRIPIDDFRSISTPVSTKDLKFLLQQLLLRQNRFQTLMDIRDEYTPQYNPNYNPQPIYEEQYRQKPIFVPRSRYVRPYNQFVRQVSYDPNYPYQPVYQNQFPNGNEYRTPEDSYRNDIMNYDPAMPYESQRFVPRRKYYRPRIYEQRFEETTGNTVAEHNEDQPEFLPPDVREALLLKMLMLAIHPDFQVSQETMPMATTPVPEYKKKVRNVQILGEEPEIKSIEEQKRNERVSNSQS